MLVSNINLCKEKRLTVRSATVKVLQKVQQSNCKICNNFWSLLLYFREGVHFCQGTIIHIWMLFVQSKGSVFCSLTGFTESNKPLAHWNRFMDQLLLWPPVSPLPSFTPKEKAHDHSKQRGSSSFLESNHKYTARNIFPFFSLKRTHVVGKEIKIKRSIKKTGWNTTQRTIDRRNNLRKEKKNLHDFFCYRH